MPYLGKFIYSMRPIEVTSGTTCTMAVDLEGNLYFNPEFVETLSPTQGAYVILHETCHLLLSHCHRFKKVLPEYSKEEQSLFNIAADLTVEQGLSSLRAHRPTGLVAIDGGWPSIGIDRFLDVPGIEVNMTVEEYYWALNHHQQQEQKKKKQKQKEEKQPPKKKGADAGPVDGDEPQQPQGPPDGGSAADGVVRPYEIPHGDLAAQSRVDSQLRDCEVAIKDFEASHGRGSVPGMFAAAIEARLRPTPDPWALLRTQVARNVASTVGQPSGTYLKLSKKQIEGVLLQGIVRHKPKAVLVIDTSGSMMDDDTKAMCCNVVKQGLRRVTRPMVVCADTKVRSAKLVSALSQFEWKGGGGTAMGKVLTEVDKEHKPDCIILVTDGETDWPERTRARLIIVLTSPAKTPAWAKTLVVGGVNR